MKLLNVGSNTIGKGLLGSILLLLSFVSLAQQRVDESMDTGDSPYVKIEHVNGEAKIVGWDKSSVKVTGTLGEYTDEFIFRQSGNDVIIKVEIERKNFSWGKSGSDKGDDLTIHVPIASKLSYSSINADVDITQITGGTDIEVVNGDISTSGVSGKLRVESVNGDMSLGNVKGELRIETVNGSVKGRQSGGDELRVESVNGPIDIHSDSQNVKVETVNGDMDLTLAQVSDVSLTTVNGRVDASMELLDKGDVRADSVGGEVTLRFQKDVSARFDVEAHAGGRIKNAITDDKMNKAKYGPRRWIEFSSNGGDGSVRVSTVSGTIALTTR